MVVQHIRVVLRGDRDLIGDAPADDGSVIIVLNDQFLHLGDGVLAAVRHVLGDVGDLRPDHHAALVAQVVEVLIVLVMREADCVDAHLADHVHVLEVHLLRQRVADALAVLVAGYAVERVFFAVEVESRLGITGKIPHAESGLHTVNFFFVHSEDRLRGVEIRVFDTVPHPCVFDAHLSVRSVSFRDAFPVRVQDPDCDFSILTVCICLHADLSAGISFCRPCRHLDAGTSEVIHIKVLFIHPDQKSISVYSAVESEIRFLGVNSVVPAVIGPYFEVVLIGEKVRDVPAECRVTAVVRTDHSSVQLCFGRSVDTAKFQVDPLIGGELRLCEILLVQVGASPVVVSAVLSVYGVPGMRQVHCSSHSIGPGKAPVPVYLYEFPHTPLLHWFFTSVTDLAAILTLMRKL